MLQLEPTFVQERFIVLELVPNTTQFVLHPV